MAKAIWKYLIRSGVRTLGMPQGAMVLSVQLQAGEPMLWAMVDLGNVMEDRTFICVGTGDIPNELKPSQYVGTFLVEGDRLAYHLFEITPPPPESGE